MFPEGTEASDLTLELQDNKDKTQPSKRSFQHEVAASGAATFAIPTKQRAFRAGASTNSGHIFR